MADLPTRQELFAVGRRSIVLSADRRRINPATVDVAGSDLNLLVGSTSLMTEEVVSRLAKCLKGLFIETAVGSQLDRLAFDRFGLTRKSASPASVTLNFTRPTPGASTPGTYPAGSRIKTPDGTLFALNTDLVVGGFDTNLFVDATATEAGIDTNVAANTLILFADPIFDDTFSVTNAAAAAGGTEGESDVEFRARIRDFFPSVRRGTLGALEFGARTVPGVASATAVELVDAALVPSGFVRLTVADINGGFSETMLQSVRDALLEFRALGVPVFVQGGSVFSQAVQWDISVRTGFSADRVQEDVRAVTVAAAQFLNPGETLLRSTLIAAARTVPGAIIGASALVTPADDTVPLETQLIRILSSDVTFV